MRHKSGPRTADVARAGRRARAHRGGGLTPPRDRADLYDDVTENRMPHPETTNPMAGDPAERARGLLGAVLECWAGDCLRLRASGLDRPSWRTRAEGPGRPLGVREMAPASRVAA